MDHIIESQQFDRELLDVLFKTANNLEADPQPLMKGYLLASLFYEPSTRTRFSFESAMMRLGGNVLTTENAREFSSASKGETLEDTIRVIQEYADVIVLRHYEIGAAARAAAVANVPIINAGDGPGQHPTQALLDLYTIERERGGIDGTKIALVGDLKYGRTIRSLCYLLGKYKDIQITFVSLPSLRVGGDIKEYLDKHKVTYRESESLEDANGTTNVVYQTRIQKERFASEGEYEECKGNFIITREFADQLKEDAIIMHPLPRVDEIESEVDTSPKAVYFKQAKYGVLVRMALLTMLLKK